jgi:class 3 adenylate cyclase
MLREEAGTIVGDRSGDWIPAALLSYVTPAVARRLAAAPTSITAPSVDEAQGVCLLLDIAGFTRLTERLARRGAAGAEELARILNHRFGGFVERCSDHGGEVVSFAGDALQVIWWARDEPLAGSALRAAACALELIELAQEARDEVALSVKITMSAGRATGSATS